LSIKYLVVLYHFILLPKAAKVYFVVTSFAYLVQFGK